MTSPSHHHQRPDFGFLDEGAIKELRRAILKAIAIPGYQTPFASRDMPIARGFGTGGLQVTLALAEPSDTVKVIDQGSDETVNAANLRRFISQACPGVKTTTRTQDADLIQTRHRIPERALCAEQILVFQVPYPDPLVIVEPSLEKRQRLHAAADYGRLWTKLYEDLAQYGEITISHRYPVRVNNHYVIDPSPIPRWDLVKLDGAECSFLFGAGREKRIYAVPPHTPVKPLMFADVPFTTERFEGPDGAPARCALCGAAHTFLDVVTLTDGVTQYQCSDTDHCAQTRRRRAAAAQTERVEP